MKRGKSVGSYGHRFDTHFFDDRRMWRRFDEEIPLEFLVTISEQLISKGTEGFSWRYVIADGYTPFSKPGLGLRAYQS